MRIALTGNPNSGKTTMYNALTGPALPWTEKKVQLKKIIMMARRN